MSSSIFNFKYFRQYVQLSGHVKAWHLLLVAGWAAVTFLSISLLDRYFSKDDYTQFRVDPPELHYGDAEVLFVGSSVTAYGINPQLYAPESANLTSKGCDYVVLSTALERTLDLAPNLKAVVLELYIYPLRIDIVEARVGDFADFHAMGVSLWDFRRNLYWKLRHFAKDTFLHPIYYGTRLTPASLIWPPKQRLMIPRYTSPAEDVVNGYVKNTKVSLDVENSAQAWIENYLVDLRYNMVEENGEAFLQMMKTVKDRGLELLVIRYPQHGTFRDIRLEEWNRQYDTAIENAFEQFGDQFQYLDMIQHPAFTDTHYGDAVHLRPQGAELLAEMLRPSIEALAKGKPVDVSLTAPLAE